MLGFLNSDDEIQKHGSKIPHWQQDGAMQFVTFRLGDSLPASKLAEWQEGRRIFLEQNPKPWTHEKEFVFHRRFTQHFANCVRYIRRNPRHFTQGTFTLWESDRAKSVTAYKE